MQCVAYLVGQVCPAAQTLEVVDQQVLQASNHWGLAAHANGCAALVLVCLLALELWSERGRWGQQTHVRNCWLESSGWSTTVDIQQQHA